MTPTPARAVTTGTPGWQKIKQYWTRGTLAVGGLLTIIATFMGWLSFPIVGPFSLWKLSDIVNEIAGVADSFGRSFGIQSNPEIRAGTAALHQAGLGLSLLPWGVILLGAPAVGLSVILNNGQKLRRAASFFGGVIAIFGLLSIIAIAVATSEDPLLGLSVGPIIMLVSGLLILSGAVGHPNEPTYDTLATASDGESDKVTSHTAQVAYSLGVLGVILILVGVILLATVGESSSSTSASTNDAASAQQNLPPSLPTSPAAAPPVAQQPDDGRDSGPGDVVAQYFDAINAHDYHTAWVIGGKNITGMTYDQFVNSFSTTSRDRWLQTYVAPRDNTVYGTLRATQTDGTIKIFQGSYTTDGNGTIISADIQQVK